MRLMRRALPTANSRSRFSAAETTQPRKPSRPEHRLHRIGFLSERIAQRAGSQHERLLQMASILAIIP